MFRTGKNRIRYRLEHLSNTFVLQEPIDSLDDKLVLERHKEYHSIFGEVSDVLRFIDDSALFIDSIFNEYGAEAVIRLWRDVRNPQTDVWEIDISGTLDLYSYNKEGDVTSVKFNTLGISTILASRKSQKVEIERTTDLDGNDIGGLTTESLALNGRQIFLISQDVKPTREQFIESLPGGDVTANNYKIYRDDQSEVLKPALLCKIATQSDDHFHAQIEEGSNLVYNSTNDTYYLDESGVNANMLIYGDSMSDKTLGISVKLKQTISDLSGFLTQGIDLELNLYKYSDGVSYNSETLVHTFASLNFKTGDDAVLDIDEQINVDLLAHDSLSLRYKLTYNGSSILSAVTSLHSVTDMLDITVTEDSVFPATTTKIIRIHELGKILSRIIGIKNFKSNYLGRIQDGYSENGKASLIGFSSGMWVRGFENGTDMYRPFTTSMNDYLKSINVTECIGVGVEKKGLSEVLRIENRDYFYQKFVGVKLGDVSDLKKTVATDLVVSSLEVGYEKPKDDDLYEEAMGLDEFNTKTELSFPIKRFDKSVKLLSKYRFDSYGKEFARRKPFTTYPTTDTRYDGDIFGTDIEEVTLNGYRESLWGDDLDEQPDNVYSPDTATNLMYSPMRLLIKHAGFLKSGIKDVNNWIRYASSLGNSNLKTKKDGIVTTENQDIQAKDLPRKKTQAIYHIFTAELTVIRSKLYEKTNGVLNMYGLIEYNYRGKTYRGHLMSIDFWKSQVKVLQE